MRVWFVFLSFLLNPGQSEIALDPDLEEGVVQAYQGNYQQALEFFQVRLELSEEEPVLNYFVGLCHFFLGNRDDSIEHLLRALDNHAPFPEAYYWAAQALDSSGKTSQARKILIKGRDRFPENRKLAVLSTQLADSEGSPDGG